MRKTKHFWRVTFLSGFFGGLGIFIVLHLVLLLSVEYFSVYYLIIYCLPLLVMVVALHWLRNKNSELVFNFRKSLWINLITGLIITLTFSLTIYFIYNFIDPSALDSRFYLIESELLQKGAAGHLSHDSRLVQQLMSPISFAIYFGIINLLLLPFFAVLIAIFAKRKNTRHELIDWYD